MSQKKQNEFIAQKITVMMSSILQLVRPLLKIIIISLIVRLKPSLKNNFTYNVFLIPT